jgi:rod shape-determining protein MreC
LGFVRNRPLIITIVILAVIILLVAATASSDSIPRGTAVAGSAFAPLQTFFYNISDGLAGFFGGGSSVSQEEQDALVSELNGYKTRMLDYDEIVAENQRLADMLEYKQNNTNYDLKVARITGKEPGNWFEMFTIGLGSNDGVEGDMPVITADGLVGRVTEVGLNWSKVMAIIDGRSRISVIMERTRDIGIAGGTLSSNDLEKSLTMEFLPLDSDIVEGDTVLTSGLDEVFPKGIVVGAVQETRTSSGGISLSIKPNVDFRRLERGHGGHGARDDGRRRAGEDISDPNAVIQQAPQEGEPPAEGPGGEAEAAPSPSGGEAAGQDGNAADGGAQGDG